MVYRALSDKTHLLLGLRSPLIKSYNYAPNFEKVDGAYCFWSVRGCVGGCVGGCVTLFVPTVTFKPLKLES